MDIDTVSELLKVPHLRKYLDKINQDLSESVSNDNPLLRDPSLRIVHGGGKRIRSILLIAVATHTNGRINNQLLKACVAIELLHISSLIHDDIIDNAIRRRHQDTINVKEGVPTAILAGDNLIAKAFYGASTINTHFTAQLANAFACMCEGQVLEMASQYDARRSVQSYLHTISKKTADLFALACESGLLNSRLSEDQTRSFRNFGNNFGMVFQLTDDLLDIIASTESVGKQIGHDINEGIYTLPILYGLKSPQRSIIKPWLGERNRQNIPNQAEIVTILLRSNAIQRTVQKIEFYESNAIASLDQSSKSDTGSIFANYINYFKEKALAPYSNSQIEI